MWEFHSERDVHYTQSHIVHILQVKKSTAAIMFGRIVLGHHVL